MNPDPLVTAFQTVQAMSEAAAIQFYRDHIGRGLFADEADIFQFVADRLGVRISWTWYDFRTDKWSEGRGDPAFSLRTSILIDYFRR